MTASTRDRLCRIFPIRSLRERVENSSLGSRLASGAFWSLVGAAVSRGFMLVGYMAVARLLGQEIFGEFGMVRSTVNTFTVFAGFALGLTATKHVAEFRTADPARAGRIMAISRLSAAVSGSIIMVAILLLAPLVAEELIKAPHLTGELRIGAFILFVNALNGAQMGALAGFEAFKAVARVNLLVGLAALPMLVGGAYYGGLRGAILALAGNTAFNWWLTYRALRRETARFQIPFSLRGCRREWPTLWKFSVPAALSGFLVSPVWWACHAILVQQPGGYAQMGLLDAASQWQIAILFIPAMAGRIVLPMLSSLTGSQEREGFQKVLRWNILVSSGAALAGALPVAMLAPWIMHTYGADFREGSLILVVLALTTIFIAVSNVMEQAIASRGRMWICFLLNLLWAALLIPASLALVRKGHGALGLAAASFLSHGCHLALLAGCAVRMGIFSR